MESLTLYFSDVELEVRSDLPDVLATLRVVWGLARAPMLPTRRRHRLAVVDVGTGVEVRMDGVVLESTTHAYDALVLTERAIYRQVRLWHARDLLLHASSFVLDDRVWVLLGPSGAGKSALCWAASRAGAQYLSDELTVTDGKRVWGIPRAIQFDAVPVGKPVAKWLEDADLTTYRLRGTDGGALALPIVPGDQTLLRTTPVEAGDAWIVDITRGSEDRATPINSLQGLAGVHAAALSPVRTDLGRLVGAGRCVQLTWVTPDGGLAALSAAAAAMRGY